MQMNRKTATRLLMIQWSRFQQICVRLDGSTLFTGVNGSGKSTILDAMTYLLTGNTQFNKAARDRDRTVLAYVRGDTRSNGSSRYLRAGEVISYIAMEFWSPVEDSFLVVGVCVESSNEMTQKSNWFVCRDTKIEQIGFSKVEGKVLRIFPKSDLTVKGRKMRSADFLGRDRGVEKILRALGLRCDAGKYRSKLLKMMAFHPENNIDQFIQECVLEPGKVDSLKELREQRRQFQKIKEIYENLKESKGKLEEIGKKIEEYETKQRSLSIRQLMLCYQELRGKEALKEETERQIKVLEQKKTVLQERKAELDKRYADAEERYRIARNNDVLRGMQDTLNELNRQRERLEGEIKAYDEKLARLKHLQIAVTEILEWLGDFLTIAQEDREVLCHLAENGHHLETKIEVFTRLTAMVRGQDKIFEEEEVHLRDDIKKNDDEIMELDRSIKRLQSNIMVFPKEIETARKILQRELQKEGIQTEVRLFAELVEEVKDARWRASIETFLGRKRFHIIVDGKYCHSAMRIMQRKKLHAINVVLTDKLPDTQPVNGSAAQILKIPNIFARRYANYLLNGIHLCDSLEELHEYPKGGLMKNGMLAKSYAVSYMNIERTQVCLGQDAIKLRLERALKERQEKIKDRDRLREQEKRIGRYRRALDQVDWRMENYSFNAPVELEKSVERRAVLSEDIDRIRKNPDFQSVLQEQEDAKEEYERIGAARDVLVGDLRANEKDEGTLREKEKELAGEIDLLEREYSEKCLADLELKKPMLEEYERLRKRQKQGEWHVITLKTVRNLEGEVRECIRQLENVQLAYCRLAEIDINKRGTAYIPFYREEYSNIANIKIEEARTRLEEQAAKLESAFMNDFVAEINETVRDARSEIDAINRELKHLPFGKDTYRFEMDPKPDRNVFFRICKKLEDYMDSPEIYMNSAREDEEMERDIQEFMEVILDEEDESEYTDYRKYFVYDMKIISRQGDSEIVSDLSKKQGSASNGEKQTPYFIILAASLLQCYPRQACCARLAFIDEAFSALSRERIEQMVRYLEENHFQVFYAAPPEKISSIGTYIRSTVSLVMTGRYTNVVEGLVKEDAYSAYEVAGDRVKEAAGSI